MITGPPPRSHWAPELSSGLGTLAAAGLVPIRCGAAGFATSAARALDGMRPLKEHARDRCLGLGVIGVQATTMVPGLEASPPLLAGPAPPPARRLALRHKVFGSAS